MTLTGEDWSRLEQAFLQGTSVVETRPTGGGQKVFEAYLEAGVRAMFPMTQRLRLKVMDCRRRLALDAAREGRLQSASALLDEVRSLIAAPATAPTMRVFAEAFLNAVAAYLCYRRFDWGGTYEALRLALERDDALIAQGLPILEMHRVQIGHNWMRVLARQIGDSVAAALGIALIKYLRSGGRGELWPEQVSYGARRVPVAWEALPSELVHAMDEQLTCELAVCLARMEVESHAPLVSKLMDGGSTPSTTSEYFICLIFARSAGQRSAFMNTAPEFLERGRGTSTFLWEALVYELLRVDDHPNPDEWRRILHSLPVPWTFLPLISQTSRT